MPGKPKKKYTNPELGPRAKLAAELVPGEPIGRTVERLADTRDISPERAERALRLLSLRRRVRKLIKKGAMPALSPDARKFIAAVGERWTRVQAQRILADTVHLARVVQDRKMLVAFFGSEKVASDFERIATKRAKDMAEMAGVGKEILEKAVPNELVLDAKLDLLERIARRKLEPKKPEGKP